MQNLANEERRLMTEWNKAVVGQPTDWLTGTLIPVDDGNTSGKPGLRL